MLVSARSFLTFKARYIRCFMDIWTSLCFDGGF